MTTRTVRRLSVGTILAFAASLVLGACSSSSSSSSSSSAARQSASSQASALPAALQGALTNPVMLYPPYGFETKDGKLAGAYTEISNALAKELGLTVTNKADDFENMLVGVQSGKYPWVIAAEVTSQRLASFDFVYLHDVFAEFAAAKSGPTLANSDTALCGYRIGALAGSTQAAALSDISKQCQAAGAKAITVNSYADGASGLLALKSGQINLLCEDSVVLSDAVKSDASLKITGPTVTRNKAGIVMEKGSAAAQVIAGAVNKLIANGTYNKIMTSFGLQAQEIRKSVVNPAPSE
jgi:polar amino acid transport system substrate-binding protein